MSEAVSTDEIIGTVIELVAKEFGTQVSELGPDVNLTELEGADSVKVLRVVAQIERAYDVELDDDLVFNSKTARDVAEGVHSMLAAGLATP